MNSIVPIERICLPAGNSEFRKKNIPELLILPRINENVDTRVEYKEDMRNLHKDVTPRNMKQ